MKRLLIPILVAGGFFLGAFPAMAHELGSSLSVSLHLGDTSSKVRYRPPAYVVVKEPVSYRVKEIKHVRHNHRDRGRGYDGSCGSKKVIKKVYYHHDDHGYRRENVVYRGENRRQDHREGRRHRHD